MSRIISVEVDLLHDFMHPQGNLYVPEAIDIIPRVSRITKALEKKEVTRIMTNDLHFGNELEMAINGGDFPLHAMHGLKGSLPIPETMPRDFIRLLTGLNTSCSIEYTKEQLTVMVSAEERKFIIEKQSYDMFSNPVAEKLIKLLDVKWAIVYGVATEYCVKAAVEGLLERGITPFVILDAVKGITELGHDNALDDMRMRGARLISSNMIPDILEAYNV